MIRRYWRILTGPTQPGRDGVIVAACWIVTGIDVAMAVWLVTHGVWWAPLVFVSNAFAYLLLLIRENTRDDYGRRNWLAGFDYHWPSAIGPPTEWGHVEIVKLSDDNLWGHTASVGEVDVQAALEDIGWWN